MSISTPIVNAFLDAIKETIRAIEERNPQRASERAAHARRCGQILAIHPDFIRHAQTQCTGVAPGAALDTVVEVLLCIEAAQHDHPSSATLNIKTITGEAERRRG